MRNPTEARRHDRSQKLFSPPLVPTDYAKTTDPIYSPGPEKWWQIITLKFGSCETVGHLVNWHLKQGGGHSMSKKEAKSFVTAMIEAGSNIQAIGTTGYVLAEPVDLDDEPAYARIEEVSSRFPDRDGIKREIIDYLHKLGRVAEV
jgi:hypothetical protein